MIRVVPKAFVDIEIEKNYETNTLLIRCRRTGLCRKITHEELENAPTLPSTRMDEFFPWLQRHFLNRPIYLAKKP